MTDNTNTIIDKCKAIVEEIGPQLDHDADWAPVVMFIDKDGAPQYLVPVGEFLGSQETKNFLFLELIPKTALMSRSSGIVFITTAWALTSDDLPASTKQDELNNIFKHGGDRIAEHPCRQEVLIMQHITAKAVETHMATIIRGDEHPRLGKWRNMPPPSDTRSEGRTVEILVPALRFTANPSADTAADLVNAIRGTKITGEQLDHLIDLTSDGKWSTEEIDSLLRALSSNNN